jgi:hypothetical protein
MSDTMGFEGAKELSREERTEAVLLGLLSERYCLPGFAFVPHFQDIGNGVGHTGGAIDGFAFSLGEADHRVSFEVKVSRGDFFQELKHPEKRAWSMAVSHEFYFVVPHGLVRPDEVPEQCGLIVANKGGLRQIKAASFRDIGVTPKWVIQSLLRGMLRSDRRDASGRDDLKVFKYALRDEPLSVKDLEAMMHEHSSKFYDRKAEDAIREATIKAEKAARLELDSFRIALSEACGEQIWRASQVKRIIGDLKRGVPVGVIPLLEEVSRLSGRASLALRQLREGENE